MAHMTFHIGNGAHMCMLCGQESCVDSLPKAEPVARKPRKTKPKREVVRSRRLVSDEQLIIIAALQVLEPLLSSEAKEQERESLNYQLNPRQRSVIWKVRRHGESGVSREA